MSGLIRWRRAALALVMAGGSSVVALGLSPHAAANGAEDCPTPVPLEEVEAGQEVNGLTVSRGTTPDAFSGEVLGVLENGIAPGVDMIMVELTSEEIDKKGIWAGMSGSPVYAADGRLIGAVGYGLSFGPTPIAGVTPAEDMLALLEDGAEAPVLARDPGETTPMPRGMQRKVVAEGAANEREAASGIKALKIPLIAPPNLGAKAQAALTKKFDPEGFRVIRGAAARAADAEATEIFAGSNFAASISYGDIGLVGVGTTAFVCEGTAVAFAHPMLFDHRYDLTVHGAEALYVQPDPVFGGFKVANATAPTGTLVADRLTGIVGELGAAPATTRLASSATLGSRSGSTESFVSVPDYAGYLTYLNTGYNTLRVFDSFGTGSAEINYRISGRRADGSPFSLERGDRVLGSYSLVEQIGEMPASDVERILGQEFEDVTVDEVETELALDREPRHFRVGKVEYLLNGTYVKASEGSAIRAVPGRLLRLRILLTSPRNAYGKRTIRMNIEVPADLSRRDFPSLRVGGQSFDEWFFEDEGEGSSEGEAKSFDDVLEELASAPRNDAMVLRIRTEGNEEAESYEEYLESIREFTKSRQLDTVIRGSESFPLRLIRP